MAQGFDCYLDRLDVRPVTFSDTPCDLNAGPRPAQKGRSLLSWNGSMSTVYRGMDRFPRYIVESDRVPLCVYTADKRPKKSSNCTRGVYCVLTPYPSTMSSRPKRKCKGTNPPHLQVSKTPSPSKFMDPVTNESLSVTQEDDSSMSPQPLIVDESQEVTNTSVDVRAATDEEIIVAGTSEEWKIRAEVLAEENSSLKDKVKLLEEALLAQKAASDEVS
ncbi:Uncharacterized protein APZ42_001526 [Daphnia magna]|uniref:Uncharacterized protein n=1 Tax=Daphnia magna TaxID=35525 RepID=A0A164IX88_9CRUS|nr:Uncharacterized protein APZ42_001526 [Daphnia magna]